MRDDFSVRQEKKIRTNVGNYVGTSKHRYRYNKKYFESNFLNILKLSAPLGGLVDMSNNRY